MENKKGFTHTQIFHDVCKERSYRLGTFIAKFQFGHNVSFGNTGLLFLKTLLNFNAGLTHLVSVLNLSNLINGTVFQI